MSDEQAISDLVTAVAGDTGAPRDLVEDYVHGRARRDATINEKFVARELAPEPWQQTQRELTQGFRNQWDSRNLPRKPDGSLDYGKFTDRQMFDEKVKLFGRRDGQVR